MRWAAAAAARHGHRDAEDGVCAQPALVIRAVDLARTVVEGALIGGLQTAQGRGQDGVDVADGALHALPL